MHRFITIVFMLVFALSLTSVYAERLLVLSDLHFTADGETESLREAVCSLTGPDCALLVLGDMANSGRETEHDQVVSFLAGIREETGCPVFVLPGNHDLSGGFSPSGFAQLYDSFGYGDADFREPSGASYARFFADNYLLVMLDTNGYDEIRRDVQHGAISETCCAWLRSVLLSVPAGVQIVVCGHYPILPAVSGGNDDTGGATALAALLREFSVHVYLCGHRHSNYTLEEDGLRQIAIGVPFAWPACMGSLTCRQVGFLYEMIPLYASDSEVMKSMRQEQLSLARRMAEGSLAGTQYEGDREAIDWFVSAFLSSMEGTLKAQQTTFLSDKSYGKWQRAEVRSMAKPWILSLVEHPPEDVSRIEIR